MWNLLIKNKRYQLVENYQLEKSDRVIIENDSLKLVEVDQNSDLVDFTNLNIPNIQIERAILELLGRLFPFMPNSIPRYTYLLPALFWPENVLESSRVTFFGGSFNPWHEGHGECLRQCSDKEELIVVVPDYSPWKENLNIGPLTTLAKLSERTENKFPIYPGFWAIDSSEKRNPTASWLSEVKATNLNWLMGDDTFFNFLKWDRVEEVVSRLERIYVVPRDHQVNELKEIEQKLLVVNNKLEVIYLESHPYQDLSSTKLR
jgi:nicotinate-nucleotide adenylyltransferase